MISVAFFVVQSCQGRSSRGVLDVEIPEDALVLTSADGKLTFYSWDTGLGGTSPVYESYIRYSDDGNEVLDRFYPYGESRNVEAMAVADGGEDVYECGYTGDLYQVDVDGEEPVYIVTSTQKASSMEGYTSAYALRFEDGRPVKMPFVLHDGNQVYEVGVDYCIPCWYFSTDGLGWDWVMAFDRKTGMLYVPAQNGEMSMNDRYDRYVWQNGAMRFKGTDAGFWLYEQLHDYAGLCGIYDTGNKLIRVDMLADGTYRYACWGGDKDMASQPELVLTGGKTGIVDGAIVFTNKEYEYIVPEFRRAQGDDFGRVMIKKNGKVIQESKV